MAEKHPVTALPCYARGERQARRTVRRAVARD
jgi:hypothetical protein